jgi:DNA gyrase/topoisomerase IV subunit A
MVRMAQSFTEKLASAVLARNGSVGIRQLRNAAAAAYRYGRLDTAATLRCMAEAAEREYLRRLFDPYSETGF